MEVRFWCKRRRSSVCVPRAPILHPASTFSTPGPCQDIPDWREVLKLGVGIPVWALTTLLLKGGKNRSEFHLLWCWERGTGMCKRRKIRLGIEAIQRTGERSQGVKRVLSSVTLMVSLLIYRIFFYVKNCTELCKQRCCFL